MTTDFLVAEFAGATAGIDLSAFAPAVGSAFSRHQGFSGAGMVITSDGRCRPATTSQSVYFSNSIPPSADYSVRLKLTAKTLTGGDLAGPMVRCQRYTDTFYTFVWIAFNSIGNGLKLYKHVNGAPGDVSALFTEVGGANVAPVAGTSAILELTVTGTTLRAYFNGVQVGDPIVDADLADAGFGGFYAWTATADDSHGIQIDEVYANPDPSYVATTGGAAPAGGASQPASQVTIPVTSLGHWCSPLNWDDDGTGDKPAAGVRAGATAVWSNNPGAHGRFRWTTAVTSGNVARLQVDVSPLVAGSVPTASYPTIKYRVGAGPWHAAQVGAGTAGVYALDVAAAGVAGAGDYTLRYHFMASDENQPRWSPPGGGTIPPSVLRVTGLVVDPGATTPAAPAVLPKTLAVFGDSITEGFRIAPTGGGDLAGSDSTLTYAVAVAESLGAELAAVGFGGQSWGAAGVGGVPSFPTAFPLYSAGRARDFAFQPDYVLCVQGTNDGLSGASDASVTAAASAWLATARGKWPAAALFLAVPPGGFKRTALGAATLPDAACYLIDGGADLQVGLSALVTGGTFAAPVEGVHPDAATSGRIGAAYSAAIAAATSAGGGASLGQIHAELAGLESRIRATPLSVDLASIAGSAEAATNLKADELATDLPDSALDAIAGRVWGSSSRTITAFGFNVSLAAGGLDGVMIDGFNARQVLATIHAAAAGVIVGPGAATGTGDFSVTVGANLRLSGTMAGDARTAVTVHAPN